MVVGGLRSGAGVRGSAPNPQRLPSGAAHCSASIFERKVSWDVLESDDSPTRRGPGSRGGLRHGAIAVLVRTPTRPGVPRSADTAATPAPGYRGTRRLPVPPPHANSSAAPAGRLPLFAAPPAKGEFSIVPGSMVTHSYIVRGRGNPESFHSCNRHDARHHARRVHPWGAGALRPLLAASRWTRRDGPLRRAGGVPALCTRAHRAAQPLRLHPRGVIAGPEGPGASPGRRRCRDRDRRRGGRQVGPQSNIADKLSSNRTWTESKCGAFERSGGERVRIRRSCRRSLVAHRRSRA